MNHDMEKHTDTASTVAAASAARTFIRANPALAVYFAAGVLSVLFLSMVWTEGFFRQSFYLIEPALLLLIPAAAAAFISLVLVLRRGVSDAGLPGNTAAGIRNIEGYIRRRSLLTILAGGMILLIITIACWSTMTGLGRRPSLILHLLATILYGAAGLLIVLLAARYLVFCVRTGSLKDHLFTVRLYRRLTRRHTADRTEAAAARLSNAQERTPGAGSVFSRRILFWVLYGFVALIQFAAITELSGLSEFIGLFLFYKVCELAFLIFYLYRLDALTALAGRLASGDLHIKVTGRHAFPSLRALADALGSIRDAVGTAVEQQMKSEHLKTELITNVSHDLKTPLTSVINYTDLLKSERIDNEKAEQYIDALSRQSEKLRRLTEDLIEASKAATGNLDVEVAPCDLCVLLEQAAGEFEDRFRAAGLTLVTDIRTPGEDAAVMVLADGRHLWRVFDNLLSNICKYALRGTRVYITLSGDAAGRNAVSGSDAASGSGTVPGMVSVIFRNISAEPLNISPDLLLQRFVRGDAARSSGSGAPSGNGLGLSIADSLMKLMGGGLTVSIDGDLFKAVVSLPKA